MSANGSAEGASSFSLLALLPSELEGEVIATLSGDPVSSTCLGLASKHFHKLLNKVFLRGLEFVSQAANLGYVRVVDFIFRQSLRSAASPRLKFDMIDVLTAAAQRGQKDIFMWMESVRRMLDSNTQKDVTTHARIFSNLALQSNSVALLEFLRSNYNGALPAPLSQSASFTFESLSWFNQYSKEWEEYADIISEAGARNGDRAMLEFMAESLGIIVAPSEVLKGAARGGHLSICQWAVQTSPLTVDDPDSLWNSCFHDALSSGKLDVIKFFVDISKLDVITLFGSGHRRYSLGLYLLSCWESNNLDMDDEEILGVLNYLVDNGIQVETEFIEAAAKVGSLKILKWALSKNQEISQECFENALLNLIRVDYDDSRSLSSHNHLFFISSFSSTANLKRKLTKKDVEVLELLFESASVKPRGLIRPFLRSLAIYINSYIHLKHRTIQNDDVVFHMNALSIIEYLLGNGCTFEACGEPKKLLELIYSFNSIELLDVFVTNAPTMFQNLPLRESLNDLLFRVRELMGKKMKAEGNDEKFSDADERKFFFFKKFALILASKGVKHTKKFDELLRNLQSEVSSQ